ncbi:MAG: MmgE/PrpD family protein [Firmicutes bacterium]|nr:MmgE/PrpD family protein [Bacillota bacterium]
MLVNAVSIIDKEMTPKQYEKINDPRVYDLAEKITVHIDSSFDEKFSGGRVEIRMKDGREFKASRAAAHGSLFDPLSDFEIEKKFKDVALDVMDPKKVDRIIQTVWELEKIEDVSPFIRKFAADNK